MSEKSLRELARDRRDLSKACGECGGSLDEACHSIECSRAAIVCAWCSGKPIGENCRSDCPYSDDYRTDVITGREAPTTHQDRKRGDVTC